MKSMKERCKICKVVFLISLTISIGLIIGGFFVPPKGVIDGSVLTACGILFAFAALAVGSHAIELGYDLKFQKGDAAIEIHND